MASIGSTHPQRLCRSPVMQVGSLYWHGGRAAKPKKNFLNFAVMFGCQLLFCDEGAEMCLIATGWF